jgi:hypothetical protein
MQTLFHRTSLQCLLHTAAEVASRAGNELDVAALNALSCTRIDELEGELHMPHVIGLVDRKEENGSSIDDDLSDIPDDLADKFFERYPEVARLEDDLVYSSSDESVVEEEVKSKKKRGSRDDPIAVSGEDSPEWMTCHAANGSSRQRSNAQSSNAVQFQAHGSNSRPLQNNSQSTHANYQQQQQQQQQPNHCANPYNQQQHQHRPQQCPSQQNQQQNPYQHRPSTGCFDYNETNENIPVKENVFRTAKEVQGKLDTNDWENYQDRNSNGFNKKGNNRDRRNNNYNDQEEYNTNNNLNNNRANNTTRPQQLVKTALNGPKNMSQGLQKKFQNPKLGGNTNNNGGQAHKPPANNSNSNEADDELPEELQKLNKDLVKRIENEIVDAGAKISFDDIAGLNHAKRTVVSFVGLDAMTTPLS